MEVTLKKFFISVGKYVKAHKVLTVVISVVLVVGIVLSCLGAFVFNRISVGVTPTATDLANSPTYSRVIIFGVDGVGDYFGKCDTPNFDRIYADKGSVTYRAMSEYPTISAQNWTSILHGVGYAKHGITNTIADVTPYTDTEYPSIFKVYKDYNPNATMASIVNWGSVNVGIVEDGIGVTKSSPGSDVKDLETLDKDGYVAEAVIEYVSSNDPDIMFIQFDGVDHAGHTTGYGSDDFVKSIQYEDALIGKIYDKYLANGWGEDTLFITVGDHGHTLRGGHGRNSAHERYVTLAVYGGLGNVIAGTPKKTSVKDVASIALYALGVEQPASYDAKVPFGMFNTLG